MTESTNLKANEVCDLRLFKSERNLAKEASWALKHKRELTVSWYETPLFFRFGTYNYAKINYGLGRHADYLDFQPQTNTWYKLDFLLDWQGEQVAFFKDGIFQDRFNFYHGLDKKAAAKSEKPVYNGVDTLMLYTLSPGGSSSFADI